MLPSRAGEARGESGVGRRTAALGTAGVLTLPAKLGTTVKVLQEVWLVPAPLESENNCFSLKENLVL